MMESIKLDPEDPLVNGPVHIDQMMNEIRHDAGDYLYFRWDKNDPAEPMWLFGTDGTANSVEQGRVRRVIEPPVEGGAWRVELNQYSTAPGQWTKIR